MNERVARSLGTHDGTFHADEVTACALLLLFQLIDRDKIYRTRDESLLRRCDYICDVGGFYNPVRHQFDHHQISYSGPLSSAGMILLYLRDQGLVDEKAYRFFNEMLILGVDAHDNGRAIQITGFCTYSHIIATYVPVPYAVSTQEQDAAFMEAVDFALGHLERSWKRYQYIESCREIVAEAMRPQERCLIFDQKIPWQEPFFELGGISHPAQFIIMPSGEHWTLRGIPPNPQDKMAVRYPLPQEWAGLLNDRLREVTGISGAIFCHKGRFISVWETKDDAIQAYQDLQKWRRVDV